MDNLYVCQPDSGEMALDVVDKLVRSSAVDVIVIDSVAALVPRAELEGDMSDSQIGLQARLMSKAMRKITGSLAASQCTVIFLNQLRSKVCALRLRPADGKPNYCVLFGAHTLVTVLSIIIIFRLESSMVHRK